MALPRPALGCCHVNHISRPALGCLALCSLLSLPLNAFSIFFFFWFSFGRRHEWQSVWFFRHHIWDKPRFGKGICVLVSRPALGVVSGPSTLRPDLESRGS
eukprot:4281125-Amphidinium_carterae.1